LGLLVLGSLGPLCDQEFSQLSGEFNGMEFSLMGIHPFVRFSGKTFEHGGDFFRQYRRRSQGFQQF